MDADLDPTKARPSAREAEADELWAEHGWGLTGQQFAAIFLVLGLAFATLALVGGQ